MNESAANEESPAPMHEEVAAPPSEEPAPRVEAESAPPQRKVKAVHVAPQAPAIRKSAPKPQNTAALPKPAQVSFRVAGVGDGDTLNVRSGPSEFHPSVGRIAPGGRGVQIVGACREEWCPVRHGRLKGLGQPLLSRRGRQPAPLGATGFKQIIAVGPSRADQSLLRELVCCERPSVCDRVHAFLSIAPTFPAATQAAGVQPQAIALRANP